MDGRIHNITSNKKEIVMLEFLVHLMKKKNTKIGDDPSKEKVSKQVQISAAGTGENIQTLVKHVPVSRQVIDTTVFTEVKAAELIISPERDAVGTTEKIADDSTKEVKQRLSFSNNFSHIIQIGEKREWFVVSASATGKSHERHLPCQDNHYCEAINTEWGIAIICDGAGSAINSHLGSSYVANELAIRFFKELVINNGWHQQNTLPSREQWSLLARETCIKIYDELKQFAGHSQINFNSLACTLIVVIYSPYGLLVTHIGDGRAGYCNEQLEWRAILTPHKGEEANQTIFITSDKWITDPAFTMSGKPVPESNVITEKAIAFTALSDGCELHSFECSVMNDTGNKWHDPNRPYAKFFNPIVKNLRLMNEANILPEEANNKWRKFIERGNNGLKSELDDKTMILGIKI
jgi:hypothetical protein